MTSDTSISLLGNFAIRINGERQYLSVSGPTKCLLTLLAAHANKAVRKDIAIELLWPQTPFDKAKSALNTVVWRLNKLISGYIGLEINTHEDLLKLSIPKSIGLDTRDLETAVENIIAAESNPADISKQEVKTLQGILSSCSGQFLEGCNDHWVLPHREHYAAYYIQLLSFMLRNAAENSQYEMALKYGRNILARDPFREGTQRQVMWLYVLNGQRVQALHQYHALRKMLHAELRVDPMLETIALYQHIMGSESLTAEISGDPVSTSIIQALPPLKDLQEKRRQVFKYLADQVA